MQIVEARNLRSFLNEVSFRKSGCLIDTNVLFAANFNLDYFHDEAVEIFNILTEEKVPVYANVNIRSEFINLARRVVIVHAAYTDSIQSIEAHSTPAYRNYRKGVDSF